MKNSKRGVATTTVLSALALTLAGLISFFSVNLSNLGSNWLAQVGILGTKTYYVDANLGSDSYSGLCQAVSNSCGPLKNIKTAVGLASSGDTVLVTPGNYTGLTTGNKITIAKSGSAGAPITIKAMGAGVLTNGFILNKVNYVIIDGFDISTPLNKTWDSESYGSGVYLSSSNYAEIKNNNIHDTVYPGVYLQGVSSNNKISSNTIIRAGKFAGIIIDTGGSANDLIENNDISNTIQHPYFGDVSVDGQDADGIKFEGSGHIIRGNYIHDLRAVGTGQVNPHTDVFQVWNNASNIIIEKNKVVIPNNDGVVQIAMIENDVSVSNIIFRNNAFSGAFRGVNIQDVSGKPIPGIYFYHNTFANITDYSIELHYISSVEVKNNLFYNVGKNVQCTPYLGLFDGTVGVVTANNLDYSPSGSITKTISNNYVCSTGTGDILNKNPLLADVLANNFYLSAGSPAINAGAIIVSVASDIEGTARPQDAGYDIGSYEFSSGVAIIPTPTPTPTPIPAPEIGGTGLWGYYYNDKFFSILKIKKLDPQISFNWGSYLPDPSLSSPALSIRWSGQTKINQAGTYTFYLKTEDAAKLWVDGNLLINRKVNASKTELSRSASLTVGPHEIKVEYSASYGPYGLVLSWKGPGFDKRVVESAVLYSTSL